MHLNKIKYLNMRFHCIYFTTLIWDSGYALKFLQYTMQLHLVTSTLLSAFYSHIRANSTQKDVEPVWPLPYNVIVTLFWCIARAHFLMGWAECCRLAHRKWLHIRLFHEKSLISMRNFTLILIFENYAYTYAIT